MNDISVSCCVVGGGPAGMMVGYLLARAGIPVAVLEKHGDFLRDFRGDTIHPSTLQVMDELGLYDRLLQRPHHKAYSAERPVRRSRNHLCRFLPSADAVKFVAFMPQWDFLDFLADEAKAVSRLQTFHEGGSGGSHLGWRQSRGCHRQDARWRVAV